MSSNKRDCKFCKTELVRFRKDENGNWHRFEDNNYQIEHTYQRCKAVQDNKKNYVAPVQEGQTRIPQSVGPAPVPKETEQIHRLIFSLLNKINAQDTKVTELTKMVSEQSTIIDEMAQKITLLVERVGYPEPKKIIDPEKEDIEKNEAFQKTQETIKKEIDSNDMVPDDADAKSKEWEEISEKFTCNDCQTMFHNGWQHFGGAKFCDECKTNIEARKEWSKVKTIEQINTQDDDISF